MSAPWDEDTRRPDERSDETSVPVPAAGVSRDADTPWFGKALVPGKEVSVENACRAAMHAAGALQLMPLFPYFDGGAMVPCLSVSIGGPDVEPFEFYHDNEVDEVNLCMAGHDARVRTGHLFLAPRKHPVDNLLSDHRASDAFLVILVIIRMKESGAQMETMRIRCSRCKKTVYRCTVDAKAGPDHPHYPEFHPLRMYADAVDEFNATRPVCGKCGHVQEAFPAAQMGWRRYVRHVEAANRARQASAEAGQRWRDSRAADQGSEPEL